jgi:hypothetical protein
MISAPAVWELEGPIMFGPRTSKTLINAMGCHSCQVKNRAAHQTLALLLLMNFW